MPLVVGPSRGSPRHQNTGSTTAWNLHQGLWAPPGMSRWTILPSPMRRRRGACAKLYLDPQNSLKMETAPHICGVNSLFEGSLRVLVAASLSKSCPRLSWEKLGGWVTNLNSSSKNPSPHCSCFLCSPMAFGCECPWILDPLVDTINHFPVRFHRPYSVTVISSWQLGEGTQCHPLCYSTSTWL